MKQAVNEYVLRKTVEFLRGKPIDINEDFSIDSSVEIISAVKIGKGITKEDAPASQAGQVASNKYLVVLVGIALVLLMFLVVV